MKLALKDFQITTVADLMKQLRLAKNEIALGGSPQAVVLTSPTGSGKTVMLAAMIEEILTGNDLLSPEPEAVFLWLSDQPELNEQSRHKLVAISSRLRPADFVIVDSNFDRETFEGGRVYFLNTQKLGKDKNLVSEGDTRTYTIWKTIQNTAAQLPDKLYVIIDEAHRGMTQNARDREGAKTIIQKFVLGEPGEIEPAKLIIGLSATPERFERLLRETAPLSILRQVRVNPEDVRLSGLLKDKIILFHPEDDQPSDWSLLAEAARKWKLVRDEWKSYTTSQELPPVHPALIIQVEDGTDKVLSRTSLDNALVTLQQEIGPISDDELAHSFQEDKTIEVEGHKIQKIEASRIQDESRIKFIFFKMSLTTGWDCPRAEVMMSFRKAKDHTLIAQLIGRMVRTPLARRIEQRDFLNTVALYLPHYDADGLRKVVDNLKGDPDIVPPTEVEMGKTQVTLVRRAGMEKLFESLEGLPIYRVEKVRKISNVQRLMKMARHLTSMHAIDQDALSEATQLIVDTLKAQLQRLKNENPEFEQQVSGYGEITIRPVTIEQGEWQALPGVVEKIAINERNIEDLFNRANLRLKEGLHLKYWKASYDPNDPTSDPNRPKLELFLILQDQKAWSTLEAVCQTRINELWDKHKNAIKKLNSSEQEVYNEIRTVAKEPEALDFSPPVDIIVNKKEGERPYDKHLYVTAEGTFSTTVTSWEDDTLKEEIGRDDVMGWLRNIPRQQWSFTIPYKNAEDTSPMYPDFLIIRQDANGEYTIDILEPHRSDADDNWMKAQGLAEFATRHGLHFGRIELIRKEGDYLRRLDVNDEKYRKRVLAVVSNNHLNDIFNELP